jgi:hypothetical protein
MPPVPTTVKILESYGEEWVFLKDGTLAASGEVLYIEALPEDIIKWIGGMEIWVGNGMCGFQKKKIK